jgi:cytidine diphosphoramidate kinase
MISESKVMTNYTSKEQTGRVIWITGLSGSGKSTLATGIAELLRKKNQSVVILDGDDLRSIFSKDSFKNQNYSRDIRLELSLQYARLCQIISIQGLTVVVPTISMFNEVYTWNRINMGRYFEVYLKVPIEELRLRDPKNIYSRFDNGKLKNVAGLDLPIDEPFAPEWAPDFDPKKTADSLTKELLEIMERQSQNE